MKGVNGNVAVDCQRRRLGSRSFHSTFRLLRPFMPRWIAAGPRVAPIRDRLFPRS